MTIAAIVFGVVFILTLIIRVLHRRTNEVMKILMLLLLMGTPAHAQTLEVTYAQGKFFNIVTGEWTHAFVPGVEACVALPRELELTASVTSWHDKDGFFERDYALEISREFKRLTVSATAARYVFKDLESDHVWFVETRWLVFGK